MIIYIIVNRLTGKMYIGQTHRSLEERFHDHVIQRGNCRGIEGAIEKYGKENFFIKQLDSASTQDELNEKEKYWIRELNTKVPNGYNIAEGGNCPPRLVGSKHPNFGKHLAEVTRKRISDRARTYQNQEEVKQKKSLRHKGKEGLLGDKNPAKRLEVREKISNKNKGKIPWNKGRRRQV